MKFYLKIAVILLSISIIHCCTSNSSFSLNTNPLLNLIGKELENIASNQKNILYLNQAILQINESLATRIERLETDLNDLINSLRYFGITRLNPNFNFTSGLTHYWPFNANVFDVIKGANLYGGINSGYARDRFGSFTGALALYGGYYQAPTGVYFDENFTITAWIKIRTYRSYQRLIDFGNGPASNNVVCMIDGANNCGKPAILIYNGKHGKSIESLTGLNLGEWNHLVCMFKNGIGYVYINGTNTALGPINKPIPIIRMNNYVGRSNWRVQNHNNHLYELDTNADIDDLKIFNRALTEDEIKADMNNTFFLP